MTCVLGRIGRMEGVHLAGQSRTNGSSVEPVDGLLPSSATPAQASADGPSPTRDIGSCTHEVLRDESHSRVETLDWGSRDGREGATEAGAGGRNRDQTSSVSSQQQQKQRNQAGSFRLVKARLPIDHERTTGGKEVRELVGTRSLSSPKSSTAPATRSRLPNPAR